MVREDEQERLLAGPSRSELEAHYVCERDPGNTAEAELVRVQAACRTWTPGEIRERVETSARWAERALLALHARQTTAERVAKVTREKNGCGFNAFDAGIGCSLAEWVARGRRLTERQLWLARKILRKYAGQLAAVANKQG